MSRRSARRPARRVRDRPDLATYLVRGGVVGFLAGAALAVLGPQVAFSSVLQQVVLLGVIGAALGVLVASVVYLVVDAVVHRPRW